MKGKDGKNRLLRWAFPPLYLAWAWFFWGLIVFSGRDVWSYPNIILLLVGGLSPLLAGVGLTSVFLGREGLCELGWRIIDFRRIGLRWWVLIIALYPSFHLVVAGLAAVTGISSSPLDILEVGELLSPERVLPLLAFLVVFPLVEEVGFRGYWLDRLQKHHNALDASLLVGFFWGLWHLPLFSMEGYYDAATFDPEPFPFVLSVILTSVVVTWIYNSTNRSVLSVSVFHMVGNASGEIMGLDPDLFFLSVVVKAFLVLFLLWWAGATRLRRGSGP